MVVAKNKTETNGRNDYRERVLFRGAVLSVDPGRVASISRGLSAATPPESSVILVPTPEGSHRCCIQVNRGICRQIRPLRCEASRLILHEMASRDGARPDSQYIAERLHASWDWQRTRCNPPARKSRSGPDFRGPRSKMPSSILA